MVPRWGRGGALTARAGHRKLAVYMKKLLLFIFALLAPPALGADPAEVTLGDADVAPLLTAPRANRAVADIAAGRYDAAAKGLDGFAEPGARYLRGLALVESRRGPDALKAMAGLERTLPELSDRIAFWRARAHELAGENRAAAASYGDIREGSLLWAEAQLARSRAL